MFWSTGPKILDEGETTEKGGTKWDFNGGHLHARKSEDQVHLPPDLPDSSRRMLASISMLSIFSVVWPQLTFSLLISELFIIKAMVLPFTFTASCQLRHKKTSKVSLSLFFSLFKCFQLGRNFRTNRTSIFELQTWGLSNQNVDLGSQYLNYRLGVLVFEMQTWGLTIGPPGLDNPGFKWLPNIHFKSGVLPVIW